MKIVGKTYGGYMATLTEEEVRIICFNRMGNFDSHEKSQIEKCPEIEIEKNWRKFRDFIDSCDDNENYQTIRKKIQNILNQLKVVENFMKTESPKLKS